LFRDEAETYLVDEVRQIKEMTEKIQLMLAEVNELQTFFKTVQFGIFSKPSDICRGIIYFKLFTK
jgi:hypothetical protein